MKRKYELKRRAERQAETKQRIVEATVGLHTTVGPARTTIAAIADRAGVQRHTVYAHFPSERELFAACSAHWTALHPFPDPSELVASDDREARLRAALRAVYDWYELVEHDVAIFDRDAKVHDVTAELVARRRRHTVDLRDELASGWPRRKVVLAALAHALEFETWRSLVRSQGLSQRQAIDAMVQFVASV